MSDLRSEELDELERAVRALWGDITPKSALADEDRPVAEKLLGKKDAERLSATQSGERFRPTRCRTTTKVEYWYVLPSRDDVYISATGWNIEVYQGARKRNFMRQLDDAKCAFVLAELEKRGFKTELRITEPMRRAGIIEAPRPSANRRSIKRREPIEQVLPTRPPAMTQQPRSKKFAILDSLRSFRP